jgi:PPOX class probable F420-dependent enzyme
VGGVIVVVIASPPGLVPDQPAGSIVSPRGAGVRDPLATVASVAALPDAARSLVDRPVLAALTTLGPDGGPHTTPLWIARDGDDLLVNTAIGRVKARNVARDPRVSVCIVDPDDPMNVLAVEGTVVEQTTDGADELIDALSLKYTGNPTFLARAPGQRRLTLRIRCDRVLLPSA